MAQAIFHYLRSVRSRSAVDSILPSVVCSLNSFRSRDSLNFMPFSFSLRPYTRFSQFPAVIPGSEPAYVSSSETVDDVNTVKNVNERVRQINKNGRKPVQNVSQGGMQKSKTAWRSQEQMKDKVTLILAILEEIELTDVRLEQARKLGPLLKESLQPWHGQVNKYGAVYALQCLENKPPLALAFFIWARSQPAFVTSKHVMCTFMNILGKGKHFSLLESLLNDFSSFTGGAVNEVAFTIVMKAYAHSDQFDKMLKTYNQMLATGLHPNEYTFSILIHGLVKARCTVEAIKFFEDAKKSNCKFNQHVYGELVTLYGRTNKPEKAAAVLKEMTANGVSPNTIAYNRLMQVYCKAKLPEEALTLLAEMKIEKVSPNNVTYLILVDFFSKQNDVEQAKHLFQQARCEVGQKLESPIYNALIHMYVKVGQMSEATDLVATMKADGLTPDQATYFSLFSGYIKRGTLSAAKATLATMKKELGLVDTRSYTSLLTLCLECTSEEAVDNLGDCMEASGHWLHNMVLQLSMSPHDLCEDESFWTGIASELKKLTVESAVLADTTIMSIVAFLTKLGLENRARRFWKEARTQNFLSRLQRQGSSSHKIDLHILHPFAVKPVLLVELSYLRNFLKAGKIPEEIHIVTGWGRTREGPSNGDSIQARVSAILHQMHSPFCTVKGNGGSQNARGQEVWTWLQSPRTRSWLALK